LLRSKDETDAAYEKTVEQLQTQLDAGMKSLWDDHEQVKAIIRDGENSDPQRQDEPEGQERANEKTSASKSGKEVLPKGTIRVDIVQGHYAGEIVYLKPTSKSSFIGRSQSKKYTNNGISLPHDAEVSTSHGRFLPKNGGFVYIDDGSTNGTKVDGTEIERHAEVPLETGMKILVGATILSITLPN